MTVEMKYKPHNPNDFEYTLEITMTLHEWKLFRDQTSDKYPSWKFARTIDKMVMDAHKMFVSDCENE